VTHTPLVFSVVEGSLTSHNTPRRLFQKCNVIVSMEVVGIRVFWKCPPTFFYFFLGVILDGYPPSIMRIFITRIMPCNDLGRWVYKYKSCTRASGAFSPVKPLPLGLYTTHKSTIVRILMTQLAY
jgi:hypothetical protein